MTNPEYRIDVLTGRQVIVAAARAVRPVHVSESAFNESPEEDPFLEGHEHTTPQERVALRTTNSAADKPSWLLRIVPNLYPAVVPHSDFDDSTPVGGASPQADCHSAFAQPTTARGIHDVVIECPDHRSRLAQLSVVEIARTFKAWQMRLKQIRATAADTGIQAVSIFRNEGSQAGASLPHCHSQILATDFVGPQLTERLHRVRQFKAEGGECLFQHWLQSEVAAKERMIRRDDRIAIVCPFASRVPWHTRFCPTPLQPAHFEDIDERELLALASAVRDVVQSLDQCAGFLPHNLTLSLPPLNASDEFPWSLDLLPRSSRIAGFELLTDVDINTVAPEAAAAAIRQHADWQNDAQWHPSDLCPPGYEWR